MAAMESLIWEAKARSRGVPSGQLSTRREISRLTLCQEALSRQGTLFISGERGDLFGVGLFRVSMILPHFAPELSPGQIGAKNREFMAGAQQVLFAAADGQEISRPPRTQ